MTVLLQIAIPFLILMAGMIYYFAFYQVRTRQLSAEAFPEVVGDSIRIDCTQRALAEFASRTKRLQLVPIIVIGFFSFIVVVSGLSSGIEVSELLNPSSREFKTMLFIAGLIGVGVLLAYPGVRTQLARRKTAYELALKHELFFEVNSDSLRIPALLLLNPTFWRAVDKGIYEISVPFSEIEHLEVLPKMGNSPAGYKIVPRGKSLEWGQGFLAGSDVLQFGIGVRRDLFTAAEERNILSFLRHRLGDRLQIKVDL